MAKCADCEKRMKAINAYVDPRNPPLDEGLCLCKECYILAIDSELDETEQYLLDLKEKRETAMKGVQR